MSIFDKEKKCYKQMY